MSKTMQKEFLQIFVPTLLRRNCIVRNASTLQVISVLCMIDKNETWHFDKIRSFLTTAFDDVAGKIGLYYDNEAFNKKLLEFTGPTSGFGSYCYNPMLFLEVVMNYAANTNTTFLLDAWMYCLQFGNHSKVASAHSLCDIYNASLGPWFNAMRWDTDLLRVACFLRFFYKRCDSNFCVLDEKHVEDGWEHDNDALEDSVESIKADAGAYLYDLAMKPVPVNLDTSSEACSIYAWLYERCKDNNYFEEATRGFSAGLKSFVAYFDLHGFEFVPQLVHFGNTQVCPKNEECSCTYVHERNYDPSAFVMENDIGSVLMAANWEMTRNDFSTIFSANDKMELACANECLQRIELEEARAQCLALWDHEVELDKPPLIDHSLKRAITGKIAAEDLTEVERVWRIGLEMRLQGVEDRKERERIMTTLMDDLDTKLSKWKNGELPDGIGLAPTYEEDGNYWECDNNYEKKECDKREAHVTMVKDLEVVFLARKEDGFVINASGEAVYAGKTLLADNGIIDSYFSYDSTSKKNRKRKNARDSFVLNDEVDLDERQTALSLLAHVETKTPIPGVLRFPPDKGFEADITFLSENGVRDASQIGTPVLLGVVMRDEWRYVEFALAAPDEPSKLRNPYYRRQLVFETTESDCVLPYKIHAVTREYGRYYMIRWMITKTKD